MLNNDGTSLTDLKGYQISYGTSPADLNQSLVVNGANATNATIGGLLPGTYYFSVIAVNLSGNASVATNLVSRTLP